MTSYIKKARSVGGVILIIALSAMFLIETVIPAAQISETALITMTSLIAALLGIDTAMARKERVMAAISAYFEAGGDNGD